MVVVVTMTAVAVGADEQVSTRRAEDECCREDEGGRKTRMSIRQSLATFYTSVTSTRAVALIPF